MNIASEIFTKGPSKKNISDIEMSDTVDDQKTAKNNPYNRVYKKHFLTFFITELIVVCIICIIILIIVFYVSKTHDRYLKHYVAIFVVIFICIVCAFLFIKRIQYVSKNVRAYYKIEYSDSQTDESSTDLKLPDSEEIDILLDSEENVNLLDSDRITENTNELVTNL